MINRKVIGIGIENEDEEIEITDMQASALELEPEQKSVGLEGHRLGVKSPKSPLWRRDNGVGAAIGIAVTSIRRWRSAPF